MPYVAGKGFVPIAKASSYLPYRDNQPKSFMGQVGEGAWNLGAGALSAAGNVLDLPGSSVRDVLTLQNPFDQWLPWNWTSSQHRATGKDVFHIKDDPESWWDDIASFGIEVGLDPLTYMTFGASAAGKAGKAAKSLGMLDDIARRAPKLGASNWRQTAMKTNFGDALADMAGAPRGTAFADLPSDFAKQAEDVLGGMKTTVDDVWNKPVYAPAAWSTPFGIGGADAVSPWLGKVGEGTAKAFDNIGQGLRYSRVPIPFTNGKSMGNPLFEIGRYMDRPGSGASTEVGTKIGKEIYEDVNQATREGRAIAAEGESALLRAAGPAVTDVDAVYGVSRTTSNPNMRTYAANAPDGQSRYAYANVENLSRPANNAVRREFSGTVQRGEAITGFHGSGVMDPAYAGRGVDKKVILDAMADRPNSWHYVQASDTSTIKTLKELEDAGMATVSTSANGNMIARINNKGITGAMGLGSLGEQGADLWRAAFEGVENLPQSIQDEVIAPMRSTLAQLFTEARAVGMNLGEFTDIIEYAKKGDFTKAKTWSEYWPRYLDSSLKTTFKSRKGGKAAHDAVDPSKISRKPFLTNIEGGTRQLKEIIRDPRIEEMIQANAPTRDIGEYIASNYGSAVPEIYDAVAKSTGNVRPMNQRRALAAWIKKLSPEARAKGVYGNHPIVDYHRRVVALKEAMAAHKGILNSLADNEVISNAFDEARRIADDPDAIETVSIGDIMRGSGIYQGDEAHGGLRYIAQQMGADLGAMTDDQVKELIADIKSTPVPKSFGDDLNRVLKSFTAPEEMSKTLKLLESVTNITRGSLTTGFPAFHIRNTYSGFARNLYAGLMSPKNMIRSVKDSIDMLHGGVIKDAHEIKQVADELARRGMAATPENGTDIIREWSSADGVVGRSQGITGASSGATEIAGENDLFSVQRQFPGGIEGADPFSWGNVGRKLMGKRGGKNTTWNPLTGKWRGWGENTSSTFAPLAAGEDIGYYTESMIRLSPYVEQLRKNIPHSEAARRVAAAQVDYSGRNFTKFESQYLTKVFPFYKFSSRQPWYVAEMLGEKPGGALAQTIRAARHGHGTNGIVPDYVAETLGVPLGSQDGEDSYLTGLGLMFEDPFSFMGGGIKGAAQEAASRLNPVIKGPAEWVSGHSFFQRGPKGPRALEDMDPTIGRTLSNIFKGKDADPVDLPDWLEHFAMNSPASRFLTSARVASDPRKSVFERAMNLGTGLRTTTVSPRTKDALIRERTTGIMRDMPGSKVFERVYFPKDELEEMSPAARKEAERLQALINMLAERAKERKKAEEN